MLAAPPRGPSTQTSDSATTAPIPAESRSPPPSRRDRRVLVPSRTYVGADEAAASARERHRRVLACRRVSGCQQALRRCALTRKGRALDRLLRTPWVPGDAVRCATGEERGSRSIAARHLQCRQPRYFRYPAYGRSGDPRGNVASRFCRHRRRGGVVASTVVSSACHASGREVIGRPHVWSRALLVERFGAGRALCGGVSRGCARRALARLDGGGRRRLDGPVRAL